MEQWGFALAAFGITTGTLAIYALVLRTRTRAAETELRRQREDSDN